MDAHLAGLQKHHPASGKCCSATSSGGGRYIIRAAEKCSLAHGRIGHRRLWRRRCKVEGPLGQPAARRPPNPLLGGIAAAHRSAPARSPRPNTTTADRSRGAAAPLTAICQSASARQPHGLVTLHTSLLQAPASTYSLAPQLDNLPRHPRFRRTRQKKIAVGGMPSGAPRPW